MHMKVFLYSSSFLISNATMHGFMFIVTPCLNEMLKCAFHDKANSEDGARLDKVLGVIITSEHKLCSLHGDDDPKNLVHVATSLVCFDVHEDGNCLLGYWAYVK